MSEPRRPQVADWWVPGSALFLARASDALLRFALFFATAKLLDPLSFSSYALLTAALATSQWALSLGAPRTTLYFHARGQRGALFAWLYLLAAVAGAAVLAGVAAISPARAFFFRGLPPGLVLLGLTPLPFLLLGDSIGAVLVAQDRTRVYGAILWARNLASALVLATALLSANRLEWVLWGRLLVSALTAAITALAARARPSWPGVREFAPAAVRYGGPTALSSAAAALHRRADVFLLSAFGRTPEIGAYSLAQALAETFWLATDSLENVLFVRVTGREETHARSEAARAFRIYLALGIAVLAVGAAAGPLVLPALFPRYPAAVSLLPWLLAAAVAWGVGRPYYSYLTSRGDARTAMLCHAAGLAANVLLCALGIPRSGAAGAARACLGSYALQSVLFAIVYRRRTQRAIIEANAAPIS